MGVSETVGVWEMESTLCRGGRGGAREKSRDQRREGEKATLAFVHDGGEG